MTPAASSGYSTEHYTQENDMHPQAQQALRAVKMVKQCGPYAARQYAIKNGVLPLFRLALQLEATRF